MSTLDDRADLANAIVASLAPATKVVLDGVVHARTVLGDLCESQSSLLRFNRPDARREYIGLARYLVKDYIRSNYLELGDWSLNDQLTMSGAIMLHSGLQSVRLLHQRDREATPHAGRNYARKRFFESADPVAAPSLLDRPQRLLCLWRIDDDTVRIVHTRTSGSFGRGPETDLDVTVQQEAEDFTSYKFNGSPDEPLGDVFDDIHESEMSGTDDEAL